MTIYLNDTELDVEYSHMSADPTVGFEEDWEITSVYVNGLGIELDLEQIEKIKDRIIEKIKEENDG